MVLVGRALEGAELAELIERARHGIAGSVVVRGEPGVGKSALVDELVGRTNDARILRAQGLEAEAPLAFAALHRLLLPVMRLRDAIPTHQAGALRAAFGEEDGAAVEPFLVAIATLSMLTAAAEEQLVVCVVDDAQWLDSASADALLFAARRLGADRAAMVFAARDDDTTGFRPDGLREMQLSGLDPNAAQSLLNQGREVPLSEAVTKRLVDETRGNPLALLELPTELTSAQLEGSMPLPDHLRLTSRIERTFLDRCSGLPNLTQVLMLIASADDTGDIDVVRRAATLLGAVDDDWAEAVNSGLLVTAGSTLRVRHPLVRSAIYQAASGTERRRAHLALADALGELGDRDREAWHRASATDGPDDQVVAALEHAGSRAERRGGFFAAMTAYRRASTLTTDDARIAELTFAAARNAWSCGHTRDARLLLALAREPATDPILINDIARLRGRIEVNVGSARDAHRIFVEAAVAISGTDPQRALELAAAASLLRAYAADSGAVLDLATIATTPSEQDDPRTRCLKHLVLAMTLANDQKWPAALASFQNAFMTGDTVNDLDVLGNLGNAALQAGADSEQQHFYELMLSRARERGAVMEVIYALHRLGFSYLLNGNWAALRSTAEESLALSASVNQQALSATPLVWLTLLAALQHRDDYDSLLSELDRVVAAHPLGILTDPVHDLTRWAKGARAAAAGDPHGALHHLSRLRLPMLARMAAVERVDAAVRADNSALAREWIDDLGPYAEATGRPWALASLAYGRAMTTESGNEDRQFLLALTHHAEALRPYDEARTHLAYGEWLRRAQRRVDARQHLRQALESFRDLNAEALVGRATQELRASGETARKRDPSTLVKLTPMELKVAQLVSSGLSNKDVAAQCWVSPRTVAFHLRNVFAKAGVTSRGELAQLDLV